MSSELLRGGVWVSFVRPVVSMPVVELEMGVLTCERRGGDPSM